MKGTDRAFTLIELLTVMAIILILAGILVPVAAKAIKDGRIARAQGETYEIANAVSLYTQKYRKLPFPPVGGVEGVLDDQGLLHRHGDGNGDFDAATNTLDVYRVLQGSVFRDQNPDGIAFLQRHGDLREPLKDPWGTPYVFSFDNDYNGSTEVRRRWESNAWRREKTIAGQVCAVRSWGPNRRRDDLTNSVCDDILTHHK